MDSSKFVKILTSFVFILIAATASKFVFFNHGVRSSEVREAVISAKEVMVEKVKNCKPVLDTCQVELAKKRDSCKPKKIINSVKKDLLDSMSFKACRDVFEQMKKHCSKGCSPDLSSLIKVDSQPIIDISYSETKTGKELIFYNSVETQNLTCDLKASKFVNLRLECR